MGSTRPFARTKIRLASSTYATRRPPRWPIGAFSDATLGNFDMERKEYKEIPVEEQVEVHDHVVLDRSDGTTKGSHLVEARVRRWR
jgi:predicted DNA-binding protein with PD1-like motif